MCISIEEGLDMQETLTDPKYSTKRNILNMLKQRKRKKNSEDLRVFDRGS